VVPWSRAKHGQVQEAYTGCFDTTRSPEWHDQRPVRGDARWR
jgi:hypothetical protein